MTETPTVRPGRAGSHMEMPRREMPRREMPRREMPRWERPTLRILARARPGEVVLEQCRALEPLYGPSNTESGCFLQAYYGAPCYACDSHQPS